MLHAWVKELWHINPSLDEIRLNFEKLCGNKKILKSVETKMTNLVSDLCILLYDRL